MESFSQRQGIKSVKSVIQVGSMDRELRNGLWNALDVFYWRKARPYDSMESSYNSKYKILAQRLWHNYFKEPIDTIPGGWRATWEILREHFFTCDWNKVYDFIEFVANNFELESSNEEFIDFCNIMLEREVSGYRFIGGQIAPITSEEEVAEIEGALQGEKASEPVVIHLKSALNLFSDRQSPDYRNSIKESISAVEAMSNLIAGKDKATLGEALKRITDKVALHPALHRAFSNLYGYTSNAEGIRHALLEEPKLDSEDAKFMLVACSAFINYLKVKASKAGIQFETK